MKKLLKSLQRPLYGVAALAMLLGVVGTSVLPGLVSAGELPNRAIKISSAQQSAASQSYQVSFTLTAAAASIAIDFCGASPLYQDACTAPAGFDANTATVTAMTGGAPNDWAAIEPDTTASHIEAGGTSVAGGSSLVITFNNITNPSSLGSFFARIYTYTGSNPDWASVTNAGSDVDFGGIALSTALSVDITARVQEKLQFCVSAADPTANCGGTTTPDLTLGHGSPVILDDSATDTQNAFIQVSTNAQSGVVIRMKNSNACGGLSRDGGSTCDIDAADSGSELGATIAPGTAEFGLYCTPAGTLTAAAPYDESAAAGAFGMDTETVNTPESVTATYGSTILSSAGAVNNQESTLTFGASASLTTPAGIYTASMDLIATGTF